MPFAVRAWPVSPDPRSPSYSIQGWNFGQVVSYQWVVSSTGAQGRYAWLNDGLILPSLLDIPSETQWFSVGGGGNLWDVRLTVKKAVPPIGSPPFTISWGISLLHRPSGDDVGAGENLLYPDAIRVFGPWPATIGGSPVAQIPNGITITPAIWNLE